jgi:hypothetical protein
VSACYRSNHEAVVSVWDDTQRRYREAHAAIGAMEKKYGGRAMVYSGRDYRLAAMSKDGPPIGGEAIWRYDRKAGGWVPRRSVKGGKALAEEFDACSARNLGDVPGLPKYVQVKDGRHPFHMQGAAIFAHDGYVWACWSSVDHEDVLKSGWGKLDESLWEQVKRSELEAAREAMEAAS